MAFSKFGLILLVALAVAGCVASQPQNVVISTPFDPSDAEYARRPGSATVYGQAFMRQVGGGVVTAAGSKVLMVPAIPYVHEAFTKGASASSRGQVVFSNLDRRLAAFVRITVADASGSFAFTNIGPGEYYIITQVLWGVPTEYGVNNQGGDLIELVRVNPGQSIRVIMSR